MKTMTTNYQCDLCQDKLDQTLILDSGEIAHDSGWLEFSVCVVTEPDNDDEGPDERMEERHLCNDCLINIQAALRKRGTFSPKMRKTKLTIKDDE